MLLMPHHHAFIMRLTVNTRQGAHAARDVCAVGSRAGGAGWINERSASTASMAGERGDILLADVIRIMRIETQGRSASSVTTTATHARSSALSSAISNSSRLAIDAGSLMLVASGSTRDMVVVRLQRVAASTRDD
ncbi:MAG: hypothetical protein Q7J47_00425 [Azoarcus sp.]|nr:hypothetical protein [Azoarcus sp.]